MGQYMNNKSQKSKSTEEDFKDQMKRKWDNFGKTAEAQYKQENIESNNQIKEETINNQTYQNEILNPNQEEKEKEKKKNFFIISTSKRRRN